MPGEGGGGIGHRSKKSFEFSLLIGAFVSRICYVFIFCSDHAKRNELGVLEVGTAGENILRLLLEWCLTESG